MSRVFAYVRVSTIEQDTKNQIIERTQAGLQRVRSEGKKLGRPQVIADEQRTEVMEQLQTGRSISSIARNYNASRQTIMRIRDSKY